MASHRKIIQLYRNLLREGKKFKSYNYRYEKEYSIYAVLLVLYVLVLRIRDMQRQMQTETYLSCLIVEFPLSLLLSFLVKQKCELATVNDIHSSFKTLKSKLRRMFICTYMHLKGEQFMGKIGWYNQCNSLCMAI